MILTCPSCDTRYLTEDTSFGSEGRDVRCASCGHQWHQEPVSLVDTRTPPDQQGTDRSATGTNGVAMGWLLLVLLVGGLAAGAYFGRGEILKRFPQTERLYALVGLVSNPTGLEILGTSFERGQTDEGEPTLTVRGSIVNVINRDVAVPPLRISLKDAANQEIFVWSKVIKIRNLAPGATASFVTTIANPPIEAVDVTIALTQENPAAE